MKSKIFVLTAVSLLLWVNFLYADSLIKIAGESIPLIEGAMMLSTEKTGVTTVLAYAVNKPLEEVAGFYQAFLKENGFMVIGGTQERGFNVSVKKDKTMFSLQIYSQGPRTIIQFIW